MNVSPTRHNIEFGESFLWVPPPGTAAFFVWAKRSPDAASPRWAQVAGYNVATSLADRPPRRGDNALPGARGRRRFVVFAPRQFRRLRSRGRDGDRAGTPPGRVISIDRYALPAPNATDAGTIAAQERRVLQTLLKQREEYAKVVGNQKVGTPDGTTVERMDFAALDRRIAEIRARIVWFSAAAGGNALPRAEMW